jgi:hypothetical protein
MTALPWTSVGGTYPNVDIATVELKCPACPITHGIIVTRSVVGDPGYTIPPNCSCGAMLETYPSIRHVVESARALFTTPRLRLLP